MRLTGVSSGRDTTVACASARTARWQHVTHWAYESQHALGVHDSAHTSALATVRGSRQHPVVADDPAFLETLLQQLRAAADQLDQLAIELGKPPLALTLDDLINAAEARCRG